MSPLKIRLCSVQLKLKTSLYEDRESYYQELTAPLEDFKRGEDTLLVYPEDIGLFTLLFHRGDLLEGLFTFEEAIKYIIRRDLTKVLKERFLKRVGTVKALLLSHQREMAASYVETFSTLAKEYRAYVVAGSIPLSLDTLFTYTGEGERDKRRLYNTSLLFNPEGEIIGWQRKVHLTEIEGPLGFNLDPAPLHDLRAIPTPLGRIGIVICYDAFHQDVLRKMVEERTEILVQPTANPKPWETWQQEEWLLGIEMAMREYPFIYGVNSMLCGTFLDLIFEGQSTILAAPSVKKKMNNHSLGYLETEKQETFVAVMDSPKEEGLLEVTTYHPASVEEYQ